MVLPILPERTLVLNHSVLCKSIKTDLLRKNPFPVAVGWSCIFTIERFSIESRK